MSEYAAADEGAADECCLPCGRVVVEGVGVADGVVVMR